MRKINIGENISLGDVADFLAGNASANFTAAAKKRVIASRKNVEKLVKGDDAIYGVNTGFGKLARTRIPESKLIKLQENLILSHACGVGAALPDDIVRLIILLRAHMLAMGFSGVRPALIESLLNLLKKDVIPVIPSQGSVGASGDLAPLSHLAQVLIGRGKAKYKGKVVDGAAALKKAGLKPIVLGVKEGLSLINGTQVMTAIAASCVLRGAYVSLLSDVASALSVEGDRASAKPFMSQIHKLRLHPGQIKTASNLRRLLAGSKNLSAHRNCSRVQDPYSIRCIPQVHGASKDALTYVKDVVERELNSITDNPLVIGDSIVSGGNFHGEPIAIAMDTAAVALAELASISERRIYLLTAPLGGELPHPFLTPEPGLNSGFFAPHVTAASLVSENKMLSHPASVDSITTFGGQEDHVSMGTIGARRTMNILDNVEHVLAIELICAAQALDLHETKHPVGKGTEAAYETIREFVPFIGKDVDMKPLLDAGHDSAGAALAAAEDAVGGLEI